MIDLLGNRANEQYSYRTVSWDDWNEGKSLGNVTSGSVELSAFTDLKAACTFNFEGGEAPQADGLVRIYYSYTDDNGEFGEFAIGTFIVGLSSITNVAEYAYEGDGFKCTGLSVSGTASGYSVLKVLADRKYGMPFTVTADPSKPALSQAVALINEVGLRVKVEQESSYALTSDYTFEPDDSYLRIVNWLLASAGYSSLTTNENGVCLIRKQSGSTGYQAEFANDDNSIMYPQVVEENDWQSTPNVVRTYYEDDTVAMSAFAMNLRGSKASLESRGNRELTLTETVSELAGNTNSEKLANLISYTEKKLLDNSNEIEHVTLYHPYIPLLPNHAVSIDYAGKRWTGNVTNMKIELSPSTKCTTEIRRFVDNEITTDTGGRIIWEVEN